VLCRLTLRHHVEERAQRRCRALGFVSARGNRACLRIHGSAELLQLHHRWNPSDRRRLFGRL